MKHLKWFAGCFVIVLAAGCASPARVSQMEGRGKTEVFPASYPQVWRAAVAAAQTGSLEIQSADSAGGYIATRRGFGVGTTGENVGIWVRAISPNQTEVEVVSRSAGPPKPFMRNWERQVLSAVAANLTRDMGSTPLEPAGAEFERDPIEPTKIPPPSP